MRHHRGPRPREATGPSDDRRELTGIYAHASDLRAPDWRNLLQGRPRPDRLLDCTLTDISPFRAD